MRSAFYLVAAILLGPASVARGQEEQALTITFSGGRFSSSQLLDGGGECEVPRHGGETSGQLIESAKGSWIWEPFGCVLTPGDRLEIDCLGSALEDEPLPKVKVGAFHLDAETVHISGTMAIEEWEYCFSLDAPRNP